MRKTLKNKLKSNKGITMIVLSIAIIILAILTSMLTYYSTDAIEIKRLNNMYNDIEQLQEKVSIYFYENEKIPILVEYPEVAEILAEQRRNLDGDKYYVLDLTKLKNVELNYGKDFETINKDYTSAEFEISNYKDVYVINEESHNIYYLQGLEVEEKLYHARPLTKNEEPIQQVGITTISSIEDLVRFQQSVASGNTYENEYVVLTKNLDFENDISYDGTQVTIDGVIYTYVGEYDLQSYLGEGGTGWTPIGDETNKFLGTFEGNNYKISNLYSATEENQKLFGTETGTVQNIEIELK